MKKRVTISAAAMLLASLAVLADTYQFIISGDPVAAATANSRSVASPGTSLMSGTLTAPAAAASLEARYRTWDESTGTAIRSDKATAFILILR